MSLRGAEDEPPRPRPRPQAQAAATAAVLTDRMGGLLLHPPSAPLLHVDHGHRAPEPTPMDTGVGTLKGEARELMDKRWAELYDSKLVDPKRSRVLKGEHEDEGWTEKWNWLRARGTVAHEAKKKLADQVKREVEEKAQQAKARADAVARARAQDPLQRMFEALTDSGKRAPAVDSSDDEAPLSQRAARRPWAAADGRGRFQETVKPVYKEVYYLQWFDEDAWEDLPEGMSPLHRYYKLDRAALLAPDDPKIRPVVEPSWVGRSTPARDDYKEVDWCDNFHCFTTLELEERVPYIFFEQYESSDGVSIGLPPCRPVYLEQKKEWPTATKKQVEAFKKGDGQPLPNNVLLPTAREAEDRQSAEQPTLAEMGYYFKHVDQPYAKDTTEDRLEFWLNRRDDGSPAAKELSAKLYPNCNALFVDAKLFQETEDAMTGVLPLPLRQRLFKLIDGSPFTRVFICDTRAIDHWWYDEESSSDEE